MLRAANKHVPQATVDKLVINFICEGLQPFAVVEQPSFKELVTTLQPQAKVISRPTVRARICEAADHMKMTLVAALDKVKFVATTTDCWSAHQKSYSMNDTYKRLSRATFAKCQAIWNKTGRSHLANEVVEDKCELQIIHPNATRWNSTYLAIERIIHIIDEKGEDAIRSICEEFKVKM